MLPQISILAVLATCAAAQNITIENYFNLSAITPNLRASWCSSQFSVCGTLCGGQYTSNLCDAATLNFTCLCASNGSTPGLKFYENTIPSNECQAAFAACESAHAGDSTGQDACKSDILATCGTLDSTNKTFGSGSAASSSSASASATSSPTTSGSASGVSASTTPTTTSNAAAAAFVGAGQQYGLAALAAGALAAFGFML